MDAGACQEFGTEEAAGDAPAHAELTAEMARRRKTGAAAGSPPPAARTEPGTGSVQGAHIPPATLSAAAQNRWLAATLILYALAQMLYITATPLQRITLPDNLPQTGASTSDPSLLVGIGPDEKEHFLYLLSIAERGALPRPTPAHRTSSEQYVTYQAQHPPLFYAAAAVVYKVISPLPASWVWYILRTLCAVCGGFVIVLAARAARIAFPDRPFIGLAAGPFVAFLPMFGHITGNLSNEPLAMALGAWAWFQMVRIVRSETPPTARDAALLGVTLGLAALTRMTALLWLPAALLVLLFRTLRTEERQRIVAPVLAFATCFGVLLLPWLIRSRLAFGAFFLRTFDRPLLARGTLADFFGQGIVPAEFPVPVNAFSTALWYASTAWTPFWLIQFYLPGGGVRAAANWQRLFLALDIAALLLLFLHWSRCRSGSGGSDAAGKDATPCASDPAGRAILWAAAAAAGFCLLALIQQQLSADWNVVLSAGRYIVAAAPATALLFLFALSTRLRSAEYRPQATAALIVAALMLVFNLYSALLVRRFYADNPRQADVQPVAQTQPGGGEE